MKIAHVMAGAHAGGAELFFERLCAALHRAGDEVLPVIRRDADRQARLRAAGLAPVSLRFGGMLDLRTGGLLRQELRRFAPEVTVAWMNRAARFTPQGDWVLAGRLGGYYDLSYYRACRHLIGNTQGVLDWILRQGWPPARAHMLPNFVPDLLGAAPARLELPAGARVLLALGRLHRNKAFDVLIRALPHLPGVHAVIAGEGPERAHLLEIARQEGVRDRLHLPGWHHDTGALLAACDALVVPSRLEPLGNVVIEGFSAARPVIAADSDGPRELIHDGVDGVLVPREDAAALALAVAGVLEDPGRALRLATAGRARFLSDHAEARVVARWRAGLARMAGSDTVLQGAA